MTQLNNFQLSTIKSNQKLISNIENKIQMLQFKIEEHLKEIETLKTTKKMYEDINSVYTKTEKGKEQEDNTFKFN